MRSGVGGGCGLSGAMVQASGLVGWFAIWDFAWAAGPARGSRGGFGNTQICGFARAAGEGVLAGPRLGGLMRDLSEMRPGRVSAADAGLRQRSWVGSLDGWQVLYR